MPAFKTVNPEGMGAGRFLLGENDPMISNEEVVLEANAAFYPAGTVLGKVTATGKYKPLNPGAATGEQNFAGLLYADADISAVDRKVVVVARQASVNDKLLNWQVAATDPQKTAARAQMVAVMIVPR